MSTHILARHFGSTGNPTADDKIKLISVETLQKLHQEIAEQLAISDSEEFWYWNRVYPIDGYYTLHVGLTKDGPQNIHPWTDFSIHAPFDDNGKWFILVAEDTGEWLNDEARMKLLRNPIE